MILGCANQAGEDNRNVARMARCSPGLPVDVPGATVNRLCGSGLDAVASAARIDPYRRGATCVIAGGVESMSRAPVRAVEERHGLQRATCRCYDTTIGWRFVNPLMKKRYGVDSMPETGENVAARFSHRRARTRTASRCAASSARSAAQTAGFFAAEIVGGRRSGEARRGRGGDARRAPARDHPRGAREAADAVPRRRHGDGRQRLGRQRRRLRTAARLRGSDHSASV